MQTSQISEWIESALASSSKAIAEDKARQILNFFGVPVVEEIYVENESSLLSACEKIGFPVVIKGVGEKILHKTEKGLVQVGISDETQAQAALARMKKSAGELLEGCIIQKQIKGEREFVAGMFRDPMYGPVILFGVGGVLTEALEDYCLKLAPLDEADIEDMISGIASQKLLGEFRGQEKVCRQTLENAIKALSDIAVDYPDVKEIDINPLIITPDGKPVAVDALMVVKASDDRSEKYIRADLGLLANCFYPQSIAFIGASATPGKWGHMLVTCTLSQDYEGKVFPVNPKGGAIADHKFYKSLDEIDDPIDLAVISLPASRILGLMPELVRKKVKGLLVITSGFREVGPEGAVLEEKLVDEVKKAGMIMLGPNTMGVCNPHQKFYCTGSHVYPLKGSTALVSQSGNMGTQLLAFAEQQDIGIRAFSGSGNEAMVTIEDYMETFEIDELTRTVVLYIESVKNGKRFFNSAKRLSKKKPIVVLKGGRTRAGEKAASSHTGAMASDIRVFDAMCDQAGIIQVDQPMELLDLSAVFSSLPLPEGNRVAIMTLGGGWGVVATDLCAQAGLEVPELSSGIIRRLNEILPDYWSHENPVDIVGERDPEIAKVCLEELLKWDGCDAVINLGIHGKRLLAQKMLQSVNRIDPDADQKEAEMMMKMLIDFEDDYIQYVAQMTQKYEKPVLGVSLLTDEISRTLYRLDGCPYKSVFFPSPERAVKALQGMCHYSGWKKRH